VVTCEVDTETGETRILRHVCVNRRAAHSRHAARRAGRAKPKPLRAGAIAADLEVIHAALNWASARE
jgi:hypothetical protein